MLSEIKARLISGGMVLSDTWETEIQTWGQEVALFRQYAEGDHRAKLTPEMRQMLRVSGSALDQFNLNYCDLVIRKMGDRLTVASIEADTDAGSTWGADVLTYNRIDGLQMDVHDAALRDGITFVMVAYDNDDQQPMLAHELAWDNDTGIIPVFDRMGKRIVAAVKVWYESARTRRVNIYYADRVEKYDADMGGALRVHDDRMETHAEEDMGEVNGVVPWVDSAGNAVGVAVVAFVNRAKARLSFGVSELAAVIAPQDALNRTLVSMVMTAELSAFQIKAAVGFEPPADVSPGMIVKIAPEGLPDGQKVDFYALEQAQLVPFISEASFLIDQIGTVSQTPMPGQMGGDASSGESLKQREIGLLGKIKRFQIKGGNAWEDVMMLAARVQNAFGSRKAPAVKRWACRWENAELRNDVEVVDNVVKVQALIGDEQAIRQIAPVFKWDEDQIQRILTQKRGQVAAALASLSLPGYDQFTQ